MKKWLATVALLAAACSSNVSVSFKLINPCNEDVLFKNNQCQFFELVVSSLDPNDPLHACYIGQTGKGPLARSCSLAAGSCELSAEELLGLARVIDMRCRTTQDGPVVARATSPAMAVAEGTGGNFNLLVGNVNGFVDTTLLKDDGLGTCSRLGGGQMGRYGHTATVLADGRVFIAGGIRRLGNVEEVLATAEIFDPMTGEHKLVTSANGNPVSMQQPGGRAFHTATLLRDGRVLLAGGFQLIDGKRSTVQSAELFDPISGTFSGVSVMGSGRAFHTATMLATGEVLVAGGLSYANGQVATYYNTAIVYKPQNNSWVQTANNMSVARAHHSAALLDPVKNNGNVIIAGGEDQNGTHNSIDIYNAAENRIFAGVNVTMKKNRSHLCAVTLPNGDVMLAGGATAKDDPASIDNGIEIYNPAKPDFGEIRDLNLQLQVARMDHSCNLLEVAYKLEGDSCQMQDTGRVLIAGGQTASATGVGLAEILVIGSGTYTVEQISDDFLDPGRFWHRAVSLRNNWVLLTGGLPSAAAEAQPISQSVFFVPPPVF